MNVQSAKIAVQDVIVKEGRSKNVILFGLIEDNHEKLHEKVSEVFLQLD